MSAAHKYDVVIGMEVHVRLQSKTKMFAPEAFTYGAAANTQLSPVSMALPGALPTINKAAVQQALKMVLACNCKVNNASYFERKHYFYPDNPKGYQITQNDVPIGVGGEIVLRLQDEIKTVELHHIHIEEDAGKSIHDLGDFTGIDLNRAGVPLIEMVTEPCMQSAEEATALLLKVRQLARYLNISDGDMEKGSIKADINISLKPKGQKAFGTKVEVKNMNSMRFVKQLIAYEIKRQTKLLDAGDAVVQETRGFDTLKGITFTQRDKENAQDYRYMPEPDLPPISISDQEIENVKEALPELPDALFTKITDLHGLSAYDAQLLTEDADVADYYQELAAQGKDYKAYANWINGPVRAYLNDEKMSIDKFLVSTASLHRLITKVVTGELNDSAAKKMVFPALLKQPTVDVDAIIKQLNIVTSNNNNLLSTLVEDALGKHPDKVLAYKNGKKGVIGIFMSEIMRSARGGVNPKEAKKELTKRLENE